MNEKLKEVLETLRAKYADSPGGSEAGFSALTRLVSGVTCQALIRDFPPLVIDEPPVLGGTNAGPNPVELVLAALGACQEIMYALMGALIGVALDQVEVKVTGYLDLKGLLALNEDTPAGFSEIRVETKLASQDDPEKVKKLIEMVEKHCPVLDTLARPVRVNGKAWLNGNRLNL